MGESGCVGGGGGGAVRPSREAVLCSNKLGEDVGILKYKEIISLQNL